MWRARGTERRRAGGEETLLGSRREGPFDNSVCCGTPSGERREREREREKRRLCPKGRVEKILARCLSFLASAEITRCFLIRVTQLPSSAVTLSTFGCGFSGGRARERERERERERWSWRKRKGPTHSHTLTHSPPTLSHNLSRPKRRKRKGGEAQTQTQKEESKNQPNQDQNERIYMEGCGLKILNQAAL